MSRELIDQAIGTALATFDHAFAAGAAKPLADLFAEDARLLLLYAEPTLGRPAIRDRWAAFFERYDTSAWETQHELIAGTDGLAVSLAIYTETLRDRATGERTIIRGRAVYTWTLGRRHLAHRPARQLALGPAETDPLSALPLACRTTCGLPTFRHPLSA